MRAFFRSVGVSGLLWAVAAAIPATIATNSECRADDAPTTDPSATANAPGSQFITVADIQPATEACSCQDLGSCTNCHGSGWDIAAGAVFLTRSRPDPATIVSPATGPGSIINASDLGFGWNAGPDITVTRQMDNGLIWDARYFNDRSASSNFGIPDISTFRVGGIGVTILGGGSLSDTDTTQLDSGELNLGVRMFQGCTLLAGFRAVELQDRSLLAITSPGIDVDWRENNHLYGGQIGFKVDLFSPGNRLQFTGVAKVGAYGDTASNSLTSAIISGAHDVGTASSFVGELDFNASYQFTPHIGVRGGYMVLWIDNVALAGNVASNTTQVAGGSSSPIDFNGNVFYNGADVAIDITW